MSDDHIVCLVADRLIDGTGRDAIGNAAAVWQDDRLVSVGPRDQITIPRDARVIEGDDLTIMPGLFDSHVHLGAQAGMNYPRLLMTPRSLQLLYAVPNCAATLAAGVTTIRDAGLTPAGVKLAVERDLFPGPRMQVAVSILGQTGGHADDWMPCGAIVSLGSGVDIPDGVVDGIDGMRRRAREVLRAGGDWIKLCTSGGVLSASDDPTAAQLTVDEIAVAVYEAAAVGKRCMAHAMSAQGIKNALHAGVVSIEHGVFLDEEAIELMKQKHAYLVPTLAAPLDVISRAKREPGTLPEAMLRKAISTTDQHRRSFKAAVEAGVTIAMGTDSGVGEHGQNARELALMVDAGITPMAAITASTLTAAHLLHLDKELGSLEVGKVADLIAVKGDPLNEIALFNDPGRVRLVIKGGKLVKDSLTSAVPAATIA
ncbi:MAG TPA: amidohydrolase family protein [Candidatus Dormibacteraeota bacterium]|nr:amidohydrolase family protein [Candidatus Dormibacteraeota bacterium]